MNHIYRSIWNSALGCWVAAPETASAAASKASASSRKLHVSEAAPVVRWQPTALSLALGVLLSVGAQDALSVPLMFK